MRCTLFSRINNLSFKNVRSENSNTLYYKEYYVSNHNADLFVIVLFYNWYNTLPVIVQLQAAVIMKEMMGLCN